MSRTIDIVEELCNPFLVTLEQAIKWAGSRQKLADALQVSRQAVHQWIEAGELPELQRYKLRDLMQKDRAGSGSRREPLK